MHNPRQRLRVAVALSACAVAVLSASGRTSGPGPIRREAARVAPAPWFDNLRLWVEAVWLHEPGRSDDALAVAAPRTIAELVAIETDLLALGKAAGRSRGVFGYRGADFAPRDVQRLLQLTEDEIAHADLTRLLKRAAVYHADVAMLAPRRISAKSPHVVYREVDGRQAAVEAGTVHWEFGSRLLGDLLREDSKQAPFVRAWYAATASYLQLSQTLSEADAHLARARRACPRDPELLFMGGCALEILASPRIQGIVASSSQPLEVPAQRTALRGAYDLFREAVELAPGHVEARLRCGRTAGLLGRHEEAVAELRLVLAGRPPDVFRYYAELILGYEEEALNHRDGARAAYERAAAVFPTAQSPLLALAALARRGGDRQAAGVAMERLWALPADGHRRLDPWQAYHFMQGAGADELLAGVYAEVSGGAR
jgi:tetratricopeptide (TPR) repeat protein